MKAVIVDFRDKKAAVLCEDGSILEIPDQEYRIGQTIDLPRTLIPEEDPLQTSLTGTEDGRPSQTRRDRRRMLRGMKKIAAAAAACFLVLCLGVGTAWAMPFGSVYMKSDSSLAYTINCFDYVLEVEADNEEGQNLLQNLDLKKIVHKKIDRAVEETLLQMEQNDDRARETALQTGDPSAAPGPGQIEIRTEMRNEKHAGEIRERLGKIIESARPAPQEANPAGEKKTGTNEDAGQAAPGQETGTAPSRSSSEDRAQDFGDGQDRGEIPVRGKEDESGPATGQDRETGTDKAPGSAGSDAEAPANGRPDAETPANGQPAAETPADGQPAAEAPANGQQSIDVPDTKAPGQGQNATEAQDTKAPGQVDPGAGAGGPGGEAPGEGGRGAEGAGPGSGGHP